VNLNNGLSQINSKSDSLHLGWSPFWFAQKPTLAHCDAVGGRPPIIPAKRSASWDRGAKSPGPFITLPSTGIGSPVSGLRCAPPGMTPISGPVVSNLPDSSFSVLTGSINRRDDDDLDRIVGRCQLAFPTGARRRIGRIDPGIPDRVHLGEIVHGRQPDRGLQDP